MATSQQEEDLEPTEEDLDFERELILFKQRLEEASLPNIIKK